MTAPITTPTHHFFYGGPSPFSNWWCTDHQITIKGLTFDSAEQAFMTAKARFFGDLDTAALCIRERNPQRVKALGRAVKGYDEAEWSCVRLGFMTHVCLLKYRDNPELLAALLATGSLTLVEASPVDHVWGVGLGLSDPLLLDPSNWRGTNLLGVALMTVRTLLTPKAAPIAVTAS